MTEPNWSEIELEAPIQRGESAITAVRIRKPKAGELRGLVLQDLIRCDVAAIQKLLPRITDPVLTDHEIGEMDPADLVQCANEVALFLYTRKTRAMLSEM